MQSSRGFGQVGGIFVLGLALTALVSLPPAARADDHNNWDWKSSSDNEKQGDRDKGDFGWVTKGDDGDVKVFRVRRNEAAAASGGYLGVQVQDVTRALMRAKDLKSSEGALVNEVEDGSPADDAGIQRGDVILAVNGKGIGDSQDLIRVIREMDPGDKARLEIERDGSRQTITAKLGERSRRTWVTMPRGMSGGNWKFQGPDDGDSDVPDAPPMPMMQFHRQNMDELNQQLEDLHKQLDQLTDEIRGLRDELQRLDSGRDRSRTRDRSNPDR